MKTLELLLIESPYRINGAIFFINICTIIKYGKNVRFCIPMGILIYYIIYLPGYNASKLNIIEYRVKWTMK